MPTTQRSYTPFVATATLTSADASTPVVLLKDDAVTGRKAYVTRFYAKVNGSTAWDVLVTGEGEDQVTSEITTVTVQDTADTPNEFFEVAITALTANATVKPG